MKFTSKRLVSILLCLAMILAVLPLAAYAADSCIVAGSENLCDSNWAADDANNAMTLNGSVYEKVYTNVAAGDYQFKVVYNGEWCGNSVGGNVMFTVNTACDVTITFDPSTKEINVNGSGIGNTVFEAEAIYAVGAKVEGADNWLNGADWAADAEANKMTEVSTGVYSITYKDIPAGTYEFKFAANGSWDHSWGGVIGENGVAVDAIYNGSNIALTIDEKSDVTLTLDLSAFDLGTAAGAKFTVTAVAPGTDAPSTDAPSTDAPSTDAPSTDAPSTDAPSTDAPSTDAPSTDAPATEPPVLEGDLSDYRVTGNTDWLGNWDASNESGRMTQVSENVYKIVYTNVPAGDYQFKVTNGTWDSCWGGNGPDGNYELSTSAEGYIVISFDASNGYIFVEGEAVASQSNGNPKTDDVAMTGLIVLMVLASAAAVVVVSSKKKFF